MSELQSIRVKHYLNELAPTPRASKAKYNISLVAGVWAFHETKRYPILCCYVSIELTDSDGNIERGGISPYAFVERGQRSPIRIERYAKPLLAYLAHKGIAINSIDINKQLAELVDLAIQQFILMNSENKEAKK